MQFVCTGRIYLCTRNNKNMEDNKEYAPGLYDLTYGEKIRKAKENVAHLYKDGCNILISHTLLSLIDLVLIPIEKDGKIGYINSVGDIIVSPCFDQAIGFFVNRESIVSVRKGKKWGVIDTDGKEILPFEYIWIWPSKDSSLASVQTYNGWSVIDAKSHEVIIPEGEYELIDGFRYEYARVKNNDLWGLVNSSGSLVLPIKYTDMLQFYDRWDKPETKVKLPKALDWQYIYLNDLPHLK